MTRTQHTARRPALLAVAGILGALLLGAGAASANFDFTFEVEKAIKTGPVGFDYVKIHCEVTNTGTDPDTYDIHRDRTETPGDWDLSICVGGEDGNCYAPFVEEVFDVLPLNPGETDTISAYFTPISGEGSGYANFTVNSHSSTGVEVTLMLGCVTTGNAVVIVNDDEDADYEAYFENAVPMFLAAGTWRNYVYHFDHEAAASIQTAVWYTGDATSTLDATERDELAGYLAAGGRLLLTGQHIAYDLCDPASPNWTAESQAWYESWTNALYVQDDAGTTSLDAVPGDPVADIPLTIAGGDGANNQTSPDVLAAGVAGFPAWTYQGGVGAGAIRAEGVIYRAVTLGFGFEAINADGDRQQVMFNAIDYLVQPLIGVGEQGSGAVPATLVLDQPRPNPFNPEVSVRFTVDADGPVTLRVVDASGRLVTTLVDGYLGAGSYTQSWDGRDASGTAMASGVYLFELRAGALTETRKAVLAK
jgi:hypothetical protein